MLLNIVVVLGKLLRKRDHLSPSAQQPSGSKRPAKTCSGSRGWTHRHTRRLAEHSLGALATGCPWKPCRRQPGLRTLANRCCEPWGVCTYRIDVGQKSLANLHPEDGQLLATVRSFHRCHMRYGDPGGPEVRFAWLNHSPACTGFRLSRPAWDSLQTLRVARSASSYPSLLFGHSFRALADRLAGQA